MDAGPGPHDIFRLICTPVATTTDPLIATGFS
jgi:hypothetical protein